MSGDDQLPINSAWRNSVERQFRSRVCQRADDQRTVVVRLDSPTWLPAAGAEFIALGQTPPEFITIEEDAFCSLVVRGVNLAGAIPPFDVVDSSASGMMESPALPFLEICFTNFFNSELRLGISRSPAGSWVHSGSSSKELAVECFIEMDYLGYLDIVQQKRTVREVLGDSTTVVGDLDSILDLGYFLFESHELDPDLLATLYRALEVGHLADRMKLSSISSNDLSVLMAHPSSRLRVVELPEDGSACLLEVWTSEEDPADLTLIFSSLVKSNLVEDLAQYDPVTVRLTVDGTSA